MDKDPVRKREASCSTGSMSKSLSLVPALEQLYVQLGITDLISVAELREGLRQLEAAFVAIAVDVNVAMTHGTPLHRAVHEQVNYPHLHRAHAILGDILEMSVPAEVEDWVRRAIAMPVPPIGEEIMLLLAREAAAASSAQSFAARFVLFEATRAILKIAAWRTDGAFEAVGASDLDIEEVAEAKLDELVRAVPDLPADVRPFHLLVASAMCELTDTVETLRTLLRQLGCELRERLAESAAVERRLREIEPVEAALVRNTLAPSLGSQYVPLEQLQLEHPLLLGTLKRNTLDQRASRLQKRLLEREDQLQARRRPSFYQLLAKLEGETP